MMTNDYQGLCTCHGVEAGSRPESHETLAGIRVHSCLFVVSKNYPWIRESLVKNLARPQSTRLATQSVFRSSPSKVVDAMVPLIMSPACLPLYFVTNVSSPNVRSISK